jgi:hypothetical protein
MLENKWKFIFAGIILILVIAGWGILYPINLKNYHIISEIIVYHGLRESGPDLIKENIHLQEINRQLSTKIDKILDQYPSKGRLSQIYKVMVATVDSHNIQLNNLNPRFLREDSIFTYMNWDISLDATFIQLLEFVITLEDHHQVFTIERLNITQQNNQMKILTINLQLIVKIRQAEN